MQNLKKWLIRIKMNHVMLIVFFAACVFLTIHKRNLWEPDEGRYADIALNYQKTNTWTVPYVNGLPHIDKPPLVMWLTSISIRVLGHSEWVYRLVPWMTGIGFLVVLAGFCMVSGRKNLHIATISLCGSSLLWFVHAMILNLDMAIAFWISLSLLIYWFAQRTQKRKNQFIMTTIFWICLAMGFLTKGLIAFVIPLGIIVLFSILTWKFKSILTCLNPLGIVLFLIIIVPWLLNMEKAIPGFNKYFFIHEHFQRFLSTGHKREGNPAFYLIILLLGVLPWSIAVFDKHFWIRNYQRFKSDPFFRFLTAWLVLVLSFFSVSQSKLPGYILPALIPFCVLLGVYWMEDAKPTLIRWLVKPWTGVLLIAAILAQHIDILPPYLKFPNSIFPILLSLFFLLMLYLLTVIKIHDMPREKIMMLSAMIIGIAISGLGYGTKNINAYKSTKILAKTISEIAGPGTKVIAYGGFPRTLSVYLNHPIRIIGTHGEHLFQDAGTIDGEKYDITREEARTIFAENPSCLILLEKRWKDLAPDLTTDNANLVDYGRFGKWHLLSNLASNDSVNSIE